MNDRQYSPDEREDAMRKAINAAELIVGWAMEEDRSLTKEEMHRIRLALGVVGQNFRANPPLLPAGAWKAARIRHERLPKVSDRQDSVLEVEIHPHIFRKNISVSGGHGGDGRLMSLMELTNLQVRTVEILRDCIYWLAGECKPVLVDPDKVQP